MKFNFFILAMLISTSVFGQIAEYLCYQNQINNAELALVKGSQEKALNIYYTALMTHEGNFIKDIYNSLILAEEHARVDTFFNLLDLLLLKGLPNSHIVEIDQFTLFHSDPRWKVFLKNNVSEVHINKELKNKIKLMAKKDQKFRKMDGSYQTYADTIHKIDSVNMDFIFHLVELDEFPGENDIGVSGFSGAQEYDVLFHHYTQSTSLNEKKIKITPLLVNLVLEGKIMPNKAAHWLEMQNGDFAAGVFDILNFSVDGVITEYYVPEYSGREIIVINESRKMLGMETLNEYYDKIRYKIDNPESKYLFDVRMSTFEVDRKMLENITASMKLLK